MPKYAKPDSKAAKPQKRSMTPWIIGAGVLFLVLIALAVFMNSPRQSSASVQAPDVPAEWVNRNVLGNPEAVVTVQTWEDFLCPACQQWAAQMKPRVMEEYIETGLAKLEFRQFPLQMHAPGAMMGAMASECAADQGAFWPYHDVLFIEAENRGQAGATLERLTTYADNLGLDEGEFLQCMNEQRYRDAVNASTTEALALGYNSTPTIVINGQPMENPFDYNELKANIDRLLEAAESSE